MVFHSFISWLYFNQDLSGRLAALGQSFGETTKEEISHTKIIEIKEEKVKI